MKSVSCYSGACVWRSPAVIMMLLWNVPFGFDYDFQHLMHLRDLESHVFKSAVSLVVDISIALENSLKHLLILYLNLGFQCIWFMYFYTWFCGYWLLIISQGVLCVLFITEANCIYIRYRFEMSDYLGVIDASDAKFERIALYLNPNLCPWLSSQCIELQTSLLDL